MSEDKHTEWKESWGDERLKVICAFANAQGGVLEIGKNYKGQFIGLTGASASKLLEILPNKINNVLGIIPEIDHVKEQGKSLLLIKVKSYKNPVSCKGRFYFRSGSANQELRGNELFDFLLDKMGRNWDGVTAPSARIDELDVETLAKFRKLAVESKRLPDDILEENNEELITKQLKLTEGGALKRAGILLFHPDPEKYVTGAFIKIGYFQNDADVLFHDEIQGNLFTQVRETMKLLLTKYLKAFISYKGLYRVESYPVPESALREALINAVVHRNYGSGAPIQIRVYPDKIIFGNTCRLPAGWTVKDLTSRHQSQPYNPDIARVFFWANMIETWGRGIIQMQKACVAYGAPEPKIGGSESHIHVEFKNHEVEMAEKLAKKAILEKTPLKTPLKTPEKILSLLAMNEYMTVTELMQQMDKSESAIKRAIKKLQREGYLKRIGPDKGGHWEVVKKNKE